MIKTPYTVIRNWALCALHLIIAYGLFMPLSVTTHAFPSPAFAAVSAAPNATPARVSSIGDLTFTGVFPRIFTPNSDGFNDKAVFHFTNPQELPISGKIYDISGGEVASLSAGTDAATLLLWDGKDSGGRVVPGGIYLYKIEYQGEHLTGTVIVAR